MSKFDDQLDSIYASDRNAWREWLAANHRTSSGIWLIYYKVNSGQPSVQYGEAVKEALCFGWIDSKVKSLDQDRYKQIFTPNAAMLVSLRSGKASFAPKVASSIGCQRCLQS